MKKHTSMRWLPNAILVLGVSVCLMAAFLMVWGEPILGEDHAGITTVIGIVGIGIISNSTVIRIGIITKAKKGSL
jgi:hypothetical protein